MGKGIRVCRSRVGKLREDPVSKQSKVAIVLNTDQLVLRNVHHCTLPHRYLVATLREYLKADLAWSHGVVVLVLNCGRGRKQVESFFCIYPV